MDLMDWLEIWLWGALGLIFLGFAGLVFLAIFGKYDDRGPDARR